MSLEAADRAPLGWMWRKASGAKKEGLRPPFRLLLKAASCDAGLVRLEG